MYKIQGLNHNIYLLHVQNALKLSRLKWLTLNLETNLTLYNSEMYISRMNFNLLIEKEMYCHLSGSDKQRVTAVACCEKIAKLIPLSTSDTPSGNA